VTLDDPEVVRREYATEDGLLARRAAYEHATGPDVLEMLFDAIAEAAPRTYLEVGCGPGELAARVSEELAADVVAIDIAPRMVELARARGVNARLGDVQELPFEDGTFDCAVAAWMLFHVPDVPRALSQLARVLRPGGRLVAVTNDDDHLKELRELLGLPARRASTFDGGNAEELLRPHFAHVETRPARGRVTFPDREAVLAYVCASAAMLEDRTDVPAFDGPFIATRCPVIFVATR